MSKSQKNALIIVGIVGIALLVIAIVNPFAPKTPQGAPAKEVIRTGNSTEQDASISDRPTRSMFGEQLPNNIVLSLTWIKTGSDLQGKLIVGGTEEHQFTGTQDGNNVTITFSGTNEEYLNSSNLEFVGTTWIGELRGVNLTLKRTDSGSGLMEMDLKKVSE